MARFIGLFVGFISIFFLMPLAASAAWWSQVDRPASWRSADWGSSGLLPPPALSEPAAIYVMTARTGGFKGAFSVHSWIVVKPAGASRYTRFDKVGWGQPVRVDAYAADANWYSNPPTIIKAITGAEAEMLIDDVLQAVDSYPHSERGDYTLWPGPNSNSFIAHIMWQVPALGVSLPANAVGRDFLSDRSIVTVSPDGWNVHVSLRGWVGFAMGRNVGLEVHFLGQSIGIDFLRPALQVPGIGRVGMAL